LYLLTLTPSFRHRVATPPGYMPTSTSTFARGSISSNAYVRLRMKLSHFSHHALLNNICITLTYLLLTRHIPIPIQFASIRTRRFPFHTPASRIHAPHSLVNMLPHLLSYERTDREGNTRSYRRTLNSLNAPGFFIPKISDIGY